MKDDVFGFWALSGSRKKCTFSAEEKRNWEPRAQRRRKMKAIEKEEEEGCEGKGGGGSMKGSDGLLGRQKKDQRVGSQVLEERIVIFSSWEKTRKEES